MVITLLVLTLLIGKNARSASKVRLDKIGKNNQFIVPLIITDLNRKVNRVLHVNNKNVLLYVYIYIYKK